MCNSSVRSAAYHDLSTKACLCVRICSKLETPAMIEYARPVLLENAQTHTQTQTNINDVSTSQNRTSITNLRQPGENDVCVYACLCFVFCVFCVCVREGEREIDPSEQLRRDRRGVVMKKVLD